MSNKETPTRRDYRDAKAYLEELFCSDEEGDNSHVGIARHLIDNAHSIKVQRATDMLVLRFDLNGGDEQSEGQD